MGRRNRTYRIGSIAGRIEDVKRACDRAADAPTSLEHSRIMTHVDREYAVLSARLEAIARKRNVRA